jgi:hypothetical protein
MSGENPKIETLIQLGTTLQKLMRERKQKVDLLNPLPLPPSPITLSFAADV